MVEALTVNEFMVKVLSEKAVEMLNNDLLFRKLFLTNDNLVGLGYSFCITLGLEVHH